MNDGPTFREEERGRRAREDELKHSETIAALEQRIATLEAIVREMRK